MNLSVLNRPSRLRTLAGFAAVLSLAACVAGAEEVDDQVYECNQGGKITFSDQPCAGEERKVDIRYNEPNQAQTLEAQSADQAAEAGAIAEADLLDTQILNTQKEISRLQTERSARLAEMKQQRDIGSEERDQAAWIASQNAQIESVYQDYTARIVTATARLDDLQARRAALSGPLAPGAGPQ